MRRSRVILVLVLLALIVGSSVAALVGSTSAPRQGGGGETDADAYGAGYLAGRTLKSPQASPSGGSLVNTAEPNTFDRWCDWGLRATGAGTSLDASGRSDFMDGCRDALNNRSPKLRVPDDLPASSP